MADVPVVKTYDADSVVVTFNGQEIKGLDAVHASVDDGQEMREINRFGSCSLSIKMTTEARELFGAFALLAPRQQAIGWNGHPAVFVNTMAQAAAWFGGKPLTRYWARRLVIKRARARRRFL